MGQNALQETQEGDLLLEEDSTPQPSVFCLSLATILHIHTHRATLFTFWSPFTLLTSIWDNIFSVQATAALWAEATPPHPEGGF